MSWLRLHVHSFPSVGVILVLIQPGCLLWAEGVLRLHPNLPSYRILAVEGQSIKNRGYGGASEQLRRAQRLHEHLLGQPGFASASTLSCDPEVPQWRCLLGRQRWMGRKLPMDATVHMVPDHDEHIVTAEKRVATCGQCAWLLSMRRSRMPSPLYVPQCDHRNGFWSDGQQKGEQQQSMYERAPRSHVGF